MAAFYTETVLHVRHWNPHLFSFTCTRDSGLRFDNGQFVMIGLMVDGRPLLRAYSIASPNYEENLEFFSIKVPNGPLTSRLQHLREGDEILVSKKPTGTLLISDLKPGGTLHLFATGTGLAPFLAIVRDPATYERFDHVVLTHGVREAADLAYRSYLENELPQHEYLGELVREKLLYCPLVSREAFPFQGRAHEGRLDQWIEAQRYPQELGLPALDPARDRAMLCGSPAMLTSLTALLDARGFVVSPRIGTAGDYVIERAFVEK